MTDVPPPRRAGSRLFDPLSFQLGVGLTVAATALPVLLVASEALRLPFTPTASLPLAAIVFLSLVIPTAGTALMVIGHLRAGRTGR